MIELNFRKKKIENTIYNLAKNFKDKHEKREIER